MSDCSNCKYNYTNWCEKRQYDCGTPCKGCEMFQDGCACMAYELENECPYFVQQEEQDEVDRD